MTIVGVILSFRQLLYEALNSQLEERIPFLYGTIRDVHEHNAGAQVRTLLLASWLKKLVAEKVKI